MNKKILWLIALVLLVCSIIGEAQQPTRISRIGYLGAASPCSGSVPALEAFRQGLRDLGYVEGENFMAKRVGLRQETLTELSDLAAELDRAQRLT